MVRGLLLSVAAVGAIILELIVAAIAMPRVGTPVAGQPGSYTIHGPAGLVGGIVLALTILAIPLGIVLAVIGAITTASTRRARVEVAHQELAVARERATTPAQVAAVQAATIPGRGWRSFVARFWLVLPFAGVVAFAFLGLTWLVVACMVLQVVFVGIALVRSQSSAKRLAPGLATMPERSDDVRAAATAAGWTYGAALPPGTRIVAGGLTVQNVCTGTADGQPFVLFDALGLLTVQAAGGAARTQVSRAQTTVQMDFAAVFRLAAVQGTVADDLGWSAFGPAVQLESTEFAARFRVYCDDPMRARLVLNPASMSLLLQAPYAVEMVLQQGVLQVLTPGALLPAGYLPALVATTARLHRSARSAVADVAP